MVTGAAAVAAAVVGDSSDNGDGDPRICPPGPTPAISSATGAGSTNTGRCSCGDVERKLFTGLGAGTSGLLTMGSVDEEKDMIRWLEWVDVGADVTGDTWLARLVVLFQRQQAREIEYGFT